MKYRIAPPAGRCDQPRWLRFGASLRVATRVSSPGM
jgi:hypothetical protein